MKDSCEKVEVVERMEVGDKTAVIESLRIISELWHRIVFVVICCCVTLTIEADIDNDVPNLPLHRFQNV